MNNAQNNVEGVAQIFTGENGPVLGGILGVIVLVGMHYIVKGNYKFSARSGENSFCLQPARHSEGSPDSIETDENVEREDVKGSTAA